MLKILIHVLQAYDQHFDTKQSAWLAFPFHRLSNKWYLRAHRTDFHKLIFMQQNMGVCLTPIKINTMKTWYKRDAGQYSQLGVMGDLRKTMKNNALIWQLDFRKASVHFQGSI